MSKKKSFHEDLFHYIGGYFPVPNYFGDILQSLLAPTTWKVLTCIWRETIGRQRWETTVTLARLQTLTSISRTTIIKALRILEDLRLLCLKRTQIGYGPKGGRSNDSEVVSKYGGDPNTIIIQKPTIEVLYWLEKKKIRISSFEQLREILQTAGVTREGDITPEMWEELLKKVGRYKNHLPRNSHDVTIRGEGEDDGRAEKNNSFSQTE